MCLIAVLRYAWQFLFNRFSVKKKTAFEHLSDKISGFTTGMSITLKKTGRKLKPDFIFLYLRYLLHWRFPPDSRMFCSELGG